LLANNEAGTMSLDEVAALNDGLFLEMEVDGAILSPRQQLASTPWALAAGFTNNPGGGGSSGDRDTLGNLTCSDGQIPKQVAGVWACGNDDGGAGGGSDTLASLSCTTAGDVVKWSGTE